jgi:ubiquinone biosynthesis protein
MASPLLQTIRNVGRLTQIVNILARYGFKKELQQTELASFLQQDSTSEQSQSAPIRENYSRPRRLSMAFEELGPTFVKLGQLLAAREDLLPKEYIQEFKRLQDSAKPISPEILERLISDNFTGRQKEFFAKVETEPLGSASIGQVHRATLIDGRHVVLKVQRPEIENTIRTDLSILLVIAGLLEGAFPELRSLRPKVVVEELKKSLQSELDYFREAANTERMRGLFQDHPNVYIPQIFREYCTRHVLCMEAIAGEKLTKLEPNPSNQGLVRIGVQAFLDMTFKFGIFHADLHPGNFILMESGKLAILDFGLVARLTREMRRTLVYMFLSLVNEDIETFSHLFVELTEGDLNTDRAELESEVREIVDSAFSMPMRDLQIGKLLIQVARVCATKRATVPRDLILFFRALVALESFGKSLDPTLEILKEAAEYSKSMGKASIAKGWALQDGALFLRDSEALLKELPSAMRLLAKRAQTGQLSIRIHSDDIHGLVREIDRASNRTSLALILAALVLGGSVLTYGKQGPLFDSLATLGLIGFGLAGLLGTWLVVGILRSGRFK